METSYKKKIGFSRIAKVVVWVLLAVISLTVLRPIVGSVETYEDVISSIDKKKSTVTSLVLATTAASTVISAIPDDTASPIANQIAELGSSLGIVLAVLYLEKYSLTILGSLSATILIPGACILMILGIFFTGNGWKKQLAIIMLVCAVACLFVVPTGIWVSDRIEATFEESINTTLDTAMKTGESLMNESEDESLSIWGTIKSSVQSAVNGVSNAFSWAKQILNVFIEAVVIMFVTNCVIPILIMLCFVFLIKQIAEIIRVSSLPGPSPKKYLND